MPDELVDMMGRVHGGITTFDFEGKKVPCIIVGRNKYSEMVSKTAGMSLAIDTDLNILHDGCGHAFVDVTLAFSRGGISEKFLVNARKDLGFFELLADASMLALSPGPGEDSVFMIQLPRPDKAREALDMIREALALGDGAVTGI